MEKTAKVISDSGVMMGNLFLIIVLALAFNVRPNNRFRRTQ